jgi:carboxylate-amine ligase
VPRIEELRELARQREADAPAHELKQEQAETASAPFTDLAALRADLRRQRVALAAAAAEQHLGVAALGTSPLPVDPTSTPDERYLRMTERFGLLARQQLTCGMHAHVSVSSREEGVAVIDRLRPWLAVLTALSANSPYWHGEDTGYASYRTVIWGQWPTAGPTGTFGDVAGYDQTVGELLRSGTILDEGMIYFDARLSRRYPTVEIRVADVCTDVDDAVLIAALARGLVDAAAAAARDGVPPPPVRTELLRVAAWQAARSGLSAELVDLPKARPVEALAVIERLLGHVRASLRRHGDEVLAAEGIARILARGTGSQQQLAGAEDLAGMVREAVRRTAA